MQHNHESIVGITEDFDKIEKRINAPEIYDDDRLYLEENILRQKVGINLRQVSNNVLINSLGESGILFSEFGCDRVD